MESICAKILHVVVEKSTSNKAKNVEYRVYPYGIYLFQNI